MPTLIDFDSPVVRPVLARLLCDKTSKRNIIFATDAYSDIDNGCTETAEITLNNIIGRNRLRIQPRVEKSLDEQLLRTRKKAEVFTPSWIVNKMNNHCDEEWFGRPNVFNEELGADWRISPSPIVFDNLSWQDYIDSRRLEITCGEAPYIVSRYDAATGEIIPLERRIGIFDRKMRIVNENVADDDGWQKWSIRALQASYGYEFQGDNLLIARVNVLMSYVEYFEARFGKTPDIVALRKVANVICWNFWQMDGITGTIPFSKPQKVVEQMSFFDDVITEEDTMTAPVCRIMDWRKDASVSYDAIRGGNEK